MIYTNAALITKDNLPRLHQGLELFSATYDRHYDSYCVGNYSLSVLLVYEQAMSELSPLNFNTFCSSSSREADMIANSSPILSQINEIFSDLLEFHEDLNSLIEEEDEFDEDETEQFDDEEKDEDQF